MPASPRESDAGTRHAAPRGAGEATGGAVQSETSNIVRQCDHHTRRIRCILINPNPGGPSRYEVGSSQGRIIRGGAS
eukprot:2787717-Prymnesium_polylepis.2